MLKGLLHFLFENYGMLLRESDKSDEAICHACCFLRLNLSLNRLYPSTPKMVRPPY